MLKRWFNRGDKSVQVEIVKADNNGCALVCDKDMRYYSANQAELKLTKEEADLAFIERGRNLIRLASGSTYYAELKPLSWLSRLSRNDTWTADTNFGQYTAQVKRGVWTCTYYPRTGTPVQLYSGRNKNRCMITAYHHHAELSGCTIII